MWLDILSTVSENISTAVIFFRISEDSGLNTWMQNLSLIIPKESK